jgi:hypothetical protein
VQLPHSKTDEDFVLGLLRRASSSMAQIRAAGRGWRRVVFWLRRKSSSRIYDDLATFTADFLRS